MSIDDIMKIQEFTFKDQARSRNVPVCVYWCKNNADKIPVVIFSPGYQDQEELSDSNIKHVYKDYTYLAEYFIQKGYAFITIQHDILGDNDGLETIDPNGIQAEERKHLWQRGQENIAFAISKLTVNFPTFDFDTFIIGGHSNGGDIAKFFASHHPENVSHIIAMDARRCPIHSGKLLMFEADDTETDIGVIPGEEKRDNLEWTIIKPKGAKHISYMDQHISDYVKQYVLRSIGWFLE